MPIVYVFLEPISDYSAVEFCHGLLLSLIFELMMSARYYYWQM